MNSRGIDKKSLRIGNKLLHTDVGVYTLTGYDISRFDNPKKDKWAEGFSRIPLTPDLLWKCGCVKQDFLWTLFVEPGKPISFRWITKSFSDKLLETPFARFDGLVDIYFVDHLQSFYYDVTNQELEIHL